MTDLPNLSDFANGHYLRGRAAGEARAEARGLAPTRSGQGGGR